MVSPQAPVQRVITADDRTGAIETAAMCADVGWPASVTPWMLVLSAGAADGVDGCSVLDLGTRHLAPEQAAARVLHVLRTGDVAAHKIDSTLRGNWAAEIDAFARFGRRVLVVPAHPAAGRVCIGGVVHVHGVPVHLSEHGSDRLSVARTSRPASLLAGAVELRTAVEVARWGADRHDRPIAVADAGTEDDIAAIIDALNHGFPARPLGPTNSNVVVCGPAAVVVAALGTGSGDGAALGRPSAASGPVLVVVGSTHPASRLQVEALAARGIPVIRPGGTIAGSDRPSAEVIVIATDEHAPLDPTAVATSLAAHARAGVAAGSRTVVLVGGDTAAAFIGARSVSVDGTIELGVARARVDIDGQEIVVFTKPGAFGDRGTLVRLIEHLVQP